jgi:hypothetical protein
MKNMEYVHCGNQIKKRAIMMMMMMMMMKHHEHVGATNKSDLSPNNL